MPPPPSPSTAGLINPKLAVSNYYDLLIRQIDIYTERALEKLASNNNNNMFTSKTSLGPYAYDPVSCGQNDQKQREKPLTIEDVWEPEAVDDIWELSPFINNTNNADDHYDFTRYFRQLDPEPRPCRVVDYLNRARDEMIAEVKKIQMEGLGYCESAKDELRRDLTCASGSSEEARRERMESLIFAQKFAFILNIERLEQMNELDYDSPFKLYLVVLDFYLNRNERELLAFYLNKWSRLMLEEDDIDLTSFESRLEAKVVVNQEFLLVNLLEKYLNGLFGCRRPITRIIPIESKTLLSSTSTIQIEISEIRAVDIDLDQVDPLFHAKYDFSNIKCFDFSLGMYTSGGCLASRITECDVHIHSLKLLTALRTLRIDCRHKEHLRAKLSPSFFPSLSGALELVHLTLINCDYEQVARDAFHSLADLRVLHLASCNHSSHIDLDVVSPRLKWLRLASLHNSNTLPAFKHLSRTLAVLELVIFDASSNLKLESLAEFRHERLVALDLQIDYQHFDLGWLARFANLKFLKMQLAHSQAVFSLPDQMKSLRALNVGNSQLERAGDSSWSRLVDLKSLDLSSNRLRLDQPDVFAKFGQLVKLNVRSNIPHGGSDQSASALIHRDAFRGLHCLESLDVSFNQVSRFEPEMFAAVPNLRHLRMENMGLVIAKSLFAHLTARLRSLSLRFNDTGGKLSDGVFESVPGLEELDLSYCGLELVERYWFRGLGELRELVLIGNRIEKISSSDDVFGEMPRLEKIDLSYNMLARTESDELRDRLGSRVYVISD